MRRPRGKPRPWSKLKALAAVLLVGILIVAVRQQTQNEWESSESTTSEALRALRAADARARDAEAKAADADHALHEVRHTASTRNELNQALRARAQAADAAAAAAEEGLAPASPAIQPTPSEHAPLVDGPSSSVLSPEQPSVELSERPKLDLSRFAPAAAAGKSE